MIETPVENPCANASGLILSSHSPVSERGGVRNNARGGLTGSRASHSEFQDPHYNPSAVGPVWSNPTQVTAVINDGVISSLPNTLPTTPPWVNPSVSIPSLPMRIDPIPNPPSSNSPPPVVRSSLNDPPLLSPPCSSHQQAVNCVSAVLAGNPLAGSGDSDVEGSGDEGDDGDDDDDDMSEGDDVDDSMTLVQYQSEARRGSLVRKGIHVGMLTQKKGRMDQEGSCS